MLDDIRVVNKVSQNLHAEFCCACWDANAVLPEPSKAASKCFADFLLGRESRTTNTSSTTAPDSRARTW